MKFVIPIIAVTLLATALGLELEEVYSAEQLSNFDESILEDARSNFTELANRYGYPAETHYVTTKDGYILTIFRIPHGRNCGSGKPKIPVLVVHGLLCSADDFILLGPEKSLGYILADECYDVWFMNNRGNKYSREHVKMKRTKPEFWDFSWHEMGTQDLPATVDYILRLTGQPNLHYIGHSQGSTQVFVFASTFPEYHSKIRSIQSLSPVAYMKGLTNPFIQFSVIIHRHLKKLAEMLGIYEFSTVSSLLNFVGMNICKEKYPAMKELCTNVLFLISGSSREHLNGTVLPVLVGHSPAGCSTKQLYHYAQTIEKGGFSLYDYGGFLNLIKYGSIIPPKYRLDRVNVPTTIMYSSRDCMVSTDDIYDLVDVLPRVKEIHKIPDKKFSHLDFIWSMQAKSLVYDKVLESMKNN